MIEGRRQLVIVTATLDPVRSSSYWSTWRANAGDVDIKVVVVWSGRGSSTWTSRSVADVTQLAGLIEPGDTVLTVEGVQGVVPAFAHGVRWARDQFADDVVVACLHDDVAIFERAWAETVVDFFQSREKCGLAGFGGGVGLGAQDIYQVAYNPMQLARQDFVSNMREAEGHGRRAGWPVRVACLDGFSQIGRLGFMVESWERLRGLGIIHHAYDAALGCIARELGLEAWMIPVHCHHHGGLTAVGNPNYEKWARLQTESGRGDQQFWEDAHRIVYEAFRGVLPFRGDR